MVSTMDWWESCSVEKVTWAGLIYLSLMKGTQIKTNTQVCSYYLKGQSNEIFDLQFFSLFEPFDQLIQIFSLRFR